MSEEDNVPQTRSLFAAQTNPVNTAVNEPEETQDEAVEAADEEQVAVANEQHEATVETEVEETEVSVEDEAEPVAEEASEESSEAEETVDQTLDVAEEPVDVAAKIDTSNDIASLEAEQKRINEQLEERRSAEKSNVIAQIKTVVETYKIPVAELVQALGGLKRKGSPAKPKYKDPATGATWSGRGKPPLWIKDQDRNKFLITE